jgi:hypothetical protein
MPAILATQEAEIRRIVVQSQPREIVHKTLSQKTLHKNRACGVAQGEGPEFKTQYHKKERKKERKVTNQIMLLLETGLLRVHKTPLHLVVALLGLGT